ncbi:MAG: hypothetical protein KBT27_16140 [Prevotellaceae bacterium]|nr:hypothetical protein [Candidatus Faecinaster equi]
MISKVIMMICWSFSGGIWLSIAMNNFILTEEKGKGILNLIVCACCLAVAILAGITAIQM